MLVAGGTMLAARVRVVERDGVGAGASVAEPVVGRRATSVPELALEAMAALVGALDAAVAADTVADAADTDADAACRVPPPLACTGGGGGGTLGGSRPEERVPAVAVEGGRKKWKSDGVISRELLALDFGVSGGGGHAGTDGGVLESTAVGLAGE